MILNKQVGVFLNFVHNRFKQHISNTFQENGFNITPEQFLVMDAIWNDGTMSQQELAHYIMKDKNSVVKLIDGLEKKNLVQRVANKMDRPQNLIEVTPYANEMKDKLKEVAIKAIDHIISGISQEEMAVFIKVLSKMAENMNEETNLLAIAGQGEHPSEIEY
jgi:DNA-binding MarR family transcriptional regulator